MTLFLNAGYLIHDAEHDTVLSSYCQYGFITNVVTDLTFITRNNRSVSAHKMVLSSVSDFVKTLCTEYETIMLPDVECEVVTAFLSLLYTGQAEFNGPRQVMEFVDLTNMLGVSLPDEVREQIFMHDVCIAAHSDCKPEVQILPDQASTCIVDGQPLQSQRSDPLISQDEFSCDEPTADTSMETEGNSFAAVALPRRPESHLESPSFSAAADIKEEAGVCLENCEDPLNVDPICSEESSIKTEINSLEGVLPPRRPESPWFPAADDLKVEDDVKVAVEDVEDPLNVATSSSGGAESNARHLLDKNVSNAQVQDLEQDVHHQQCLLNSNDSVTLVVYHRMDLSESPCESMQSQERLSNNNPITENVDQCSPLNKKSDTSTTVQTHIRLQSDERPFACSQCLKRFKTKADLKIHLRTHTGERPHKCSQCEKRFNRKSDLYRHFSVHSAERPYKCSECEKSFNQKRTLNEHLRTHSGERPYRCSLCDKSFKRKSHINAHLRVHSGERPYKCSFCNEHFILKGSLDTHMRVHTVELPYKCSECEKSFNQKCTLNAHLRVHSGERPYKCSFCNKCFNWKGSLDTHMRVHTVERPYKCSQCDQCFKWRVSLDRHMRVHIAERPDKSFQCSKRYNQKGFLNRHIRVRIGERPYKCSQCQKSFSHKSNLDRHFRLHSGVCSYKCSYCDKSFREKGTLNEHFRVHSGERPYKCCQCDKSFKRKEVMDLHMRLHSFECPDKSSQCKKSFNQKDNLVTHLGFTPLKDAISDAPSPDHLSRNWEGVRTYRPNQSVQNHCTK